jgi:hypothetical protein
MSSLSSYVINEKHKIKFQLQLSYSIIVLFSAGITLGICFLLLHSLNKSVDESADLKITTQTIESVAAVSVEISNSIMQLLKISSENVVMNTVLFSSLLINYSNISSVQGTLFNPVVSYRGYNFIPGCKAPKCPSDYSLFQNSRVPALFTNGSQSHSSVYLYSQKYHQSVRNDSYWDKIVTESPEIMNVVNGLVYQDTDLATFNQNCRSDKSSCIFLNTVKINNLKTGNVNVVHRSFPGIGVKESNIGDPSMSESFRNAPVNAVYFNGPQLSAVAPEMMLVMSSRKEVYFPAGTRDQMLTFVSAAKLSLEKLVLAVNSFEYTNSGFGVIMNSENTEVCLIVFLLVCVLFCFFRCWFGKTSHEASSTTRSF